MKRPENEDLRDARPERAHSSQTASPDGAISVGLFPYASKACGGTAAFSDGKRSRNRGREWKSGIRDEFGKVRGVMEAL
jgi:hypothetical protein